MEFWFSELHTDNVKLTIRIEKQLFSGESEYQKIDVFDSDFKKMLVYALTSNQMHVFFDLYMKKCSLDLDKSVKKISTGIQLFSYISIGILVLIVYQIMMMPLNMLNQF